MAKDILSINLLDDKQKSFTDTILDWAIYIGRLLVIITEAVALFVFINRFTLDRKLIDLHDEIKKNQSFIGYMQSREEIYRGIHEKLQTNFISSTDNDERIILFEELTSNVNPQLSILSFSVNPSSLTIAVQARSIQALSDFHEKVKQHPSIASITVDKIENKTANAIILVSYTAKLKAK